MNFVHFDTGEKMSEVNNNARSIEEWAKGFATLYAIPDSYRRPEEFWNATMAHISVIGESIRRTHYHDLIKAAIHTFCWMCCYVDKCNNTSDRVFKVKHSLSEIVGIKFPLICGHCGEKTCQCDPIKMDAEGDKSSKYGELLKEWKKIQPGLNNFAIDTWIDVFRRIYGGRIHLLAFENLGFHLLEEAGEEAMAVRQLVQFRGIPQENIEGVDDSFLERIAYIPDLIEEYRDTMKELKNRFGTTSDKVVLKEKIRSTDDSPEAIRIRLLKGKVDFFIELADTFSWFCAVLLKLEEIVKNMALPDDKAKSFQIERAIIERYRSPDPNTPLTCYACEETQCKCLFFPEKDI